MEATQTAEHTANCTQINRNAYNQPQHCFVSQLLLLLVLFANEIWLDGSSVAFVCHLSLFLSYRSQLERYLPKLYAQVVL